MLGAYCWLLWLVLAGGWATFPQFPPDWFKAVAGVGYSQAIWPPSWHLKHYRELGTLLLDVPSCLSLAPWLFCPWSLLIEVPVQWPVLWPEVVCPRLVWLLWELEQPGVLLSVCPLPQPLCLGLFGVLAGLLPCPALVRTASNLVTQFLGTLPRASGHGSPSPYFITSFLVLTFHLVGSNHQLRIGSSGVTVEIPYGISDVFADPMEETVLEVVLDL